MVIEIDCTLSQPEAEMLEYMLTRYAESERDSVLFPTSVLLRYAKIHLEGKEEYDPNNPPDDNELLEHLTYMIIKFSSMTATIKNGSQYNTINVSKEFEVTPALTEIHFSEDFLEYRKEAIRDIRGRYLNKGRRLFYLNPNQ